MKTEGMGAAAGTPCGPAALAVQKPSSIRVNVTPWRPRGLREQNACGSEEFGCPLPTGHTSREARHARSEESRMRFAWSNGPGKGEITLQVPLGALRNVPVVKSLCNSNRDVLRFNILAGARKT